MYLKKISTAVGYWNCQPECLHVVGLLNSGRHPNSRAQKSKVEDTLSELDSVTPCPLTQICLCHTVWVDTDTSHQRL